MKGAPRYCRRMNFSVILFLSSEVADIGLCYTGPPPGYVRAMLATLT